MATINISDLNPVGLELFSESESYMNEISEGEFTGIQGGSSNLCWAVSSYLTGKAVDAIIATTGRDRDDWESIYLATH